MKIRKFKSSDAEAVYNLIKRNNTEITSKSYPAMVINTWLKRLNPDNISIKSKERICFIAEDKKILIGYISLSDKEIKKLFVLPEFHKKGIGRKLLQKIEKIAKKKGIKKLVLNSNIDSEPFYLKQGFRKIRINWKKFGKSRYKWIFMEKKLK